MRFLFLLKNRKNRRALRPQTAIGSGVTDGGVGAWHAHLAAQMWAPLIWLLSLPKQFYKLGNL